MLVSSFVGVMEKKETADYFQINLPQAIFFVSVFFFFFVCVCVCVCVSVQFTASKWSVLHNSFCNTQMVNDHQSR